MLILCRIADQRQNCGIESGSCSEQSPGRGQRYCRQWPTSCYFHAPRGVETRPSNGSYQRRAGNGYFVGAWCKLDQARQAEARQQGGHRGGDVECILFCTMSCYATTNLLHYLIFIVLGISDISITSRIRSHSQCSLSKFNSQTGLV